jgi:hypothetical protein
VELACYALSVGVEAFEGTAKAAKPARRK